MSDAQTGYRLDYWIDTAKAIRQGYDDGGDPESSHSDEDELLKEFVNALADELVPDPAAAAMALKQELLDVERRRWYA